MTDLFVVLNDIGTHVLYIYSLIQESKWMVTAIISFRSWKQSWLARYTEGAKNNGKVERNKLTPARRKIISLPSCNIFVSSLIQLLYK